MYWDVLNFKWPSVKILLDELESSIRSFVEMAQHAIVRKYVWCHNLAFVNFSYLENIGCEGHRTLLYT
jgi:hypothetical protein